MPVAVAASVVVVVLAITVVFCVALLRALPPDVPRIIEPFSQLCTAIVGWVTGIRFRCPPDEASRTDNQEGGRS